MNPRQCVGKVQCSARSKGVKGRSLGVGRALRRFLVSAAPQLLSGAAGSTGQKNTGVLLHGVAWTFDLLAQFLLQMGLCLDDAEVRYADLTEGNQQRCLNECSV